MAEIRRDGAAAPDWGCAECRDSGAAAVQQMRRRLAANARERRRMRGLNAGFELLRSVIPALRGRSPLSKSDTLLMAQIYIAALSEELRRASGGAADSEPGDTAEQRLSPGSHTDSQAAPRE